MNNHDLALHSERLIVRRFEERDIPDILDYSQHDKDDRFRDRNIDWEPTEESARNWWTPMATMTLEEATDWLGLVIEVKALGRVVGNTGFSTQRSGDQRQGTIGWTLGRAFEGNGYVTEAATALLGHLFLTEGFHRVYAMTSPENVKSCRLMERLGMRREAHFRKNCFFDGGWSDEYVYAVLDEEWRARRVKRGTQNSCLSLPLWPSKE